MSDTAVSGEHIQQRNSAKAVVSWRICLWYIISRYFSKILCFLGTGNTWPSAKI